MSKDLEENMNIINKHVNNQHSLDLTEAKHRPETKVGWHCSPQKAGLS